MTEAQRSTIDAAEVDRFSRMAAEWWNPQGKFRPLHKFNPTRLAYIKEKVCAHYGIDPNSPRPFAGRHARKNAIFTEKSLRKEIHYGRIFIRLS